MLAYEEYEKKVYDWLQSKRKIDDRFNFSVRVKGSKGAETDYFIGTEKSNYFSTTFWTIPVYFPGSSGEAISLIFVSKDEYYGYIFEFHQTNSPQDAQNKCALDLIKYLRDSSIVKLGIAREGKSNSKMYNFRTQMRQESYTLLDEMLEDIEKDLKIIIPTVNDAISEIKKNNPDFKAHPITEDEFEDMQRKMESRFIKYGNPTNEDKNSSSLTKDDNEMSKNHLVKLPLNQILYGPPGTGKTYTAKEKAVRIANPELFKNNTSLSREHISQDYKKLADSGQIVFTTFHQSLSYEDFIEGIKPVIDVESNSSDVSYQIEKGIFKKLCDKAKGIESSIDIDNSIDFNKKDYYKMSVGGKNRPEVHQYCLENNKILLGWGENENFEDYKNVKDWNDFRDKFENEFPDLIENSRYHIQAVYIFQKMKIGDIVLVSYGNHVIDAIGIIESEYTFDPDNKFGYNHSRKVRWLSKNMNASPDLFIDKNISQQSVYQFNKQDVKIENFLKSFHNYNTNLPKEKKHVLIIDEINRGNASAIFGELITLLEEDKRKNAKEEIEVTLPYSKEIFSIPPNLYIIGTMNTADRSVEALDTALRRRFAFEEVMPKPELFEGLEVGGISIQEVLEKINQRIEALIDRDHTIGHAYFFKVKDAVNKEEALKKVFKDNIIPLLQEYFYGDYSRIGLVLGGGFVEVERRENSTRFANVEGLENELEVPPRIQLIPINEAFDMGKALQNLMQDA